ncbi:hypothetical protein [Stakelama tenebrarum]|uniref:Uncharacterized protein n=1 Tax=Stakelama tenebrarum TaxID=2711215 RepID=A0A6G6Y2M2_9SPHN|nr:hypothetical protein [Sphingosinithalassobacter tenebrarum]QIG78968.1 hypothetical protein G5C33_03655 [Sphingosinithalassobacter tenebrarum]
MSDEPTDFTPVPTSRTTGWTAQRQRKFIDILAETGCVSDAAAAVGLTPRSAYRLRLRPEAESFHRAWDAALTLASNRLLTMAYERAVYGNIRQVWQRGEVIGEERVPPDRLLMFLLRHLDPMRFGRLSGLMPADVPNPRDSARAAFSDLAEDLTDSEAEAEPLREEHFAHGLIPQFDAE